MKLKEFPASILRMLHLRLLRPEILNSVSHSEIPVTVSCTSIPSRLSRLHYTVRSVLAQSAPPQKMVLWLNHGCKEIVPSSLKKLEGKKFQIRFTDLDSPHCKLVPGLMCYEEEVIVTCDDDLMYSVDWLISLYRSHLDMPEAIVAHRVRKIAYDGDAVRPYIEWKYDRNPEAISPCHIPMGYAGVLYPPGSLFPDVTNSELYLDLCPKADDLWFKAMSLLNGTECVVTKDETMVMYPIPGTQKISLKHANIKLDQNREQWQALEAYYHVRC